MNRLLADHALLPGGWADQVLLEWDQQGCLIAVTPDAIEPAAGQVEHFQGTPSPGSVPVHAGMAKYRDRPRPPGRGEGATGTDAGAPGLPAGQLTRAHYVVPGMVNLHSHAFQRMLAGRAERRSGTGDSFWTWRSLMYRAVHQLGPEQLRAIAAWVYGECLRHGYTSVCEFHYLHRAPAGDWYVPQAAMAHALANAAGQTGIGLTLLPVMYCRGGFDKRPLSEGQQRFAADVDEVLALVQSLDRLRSPMLEVGAAPHSLRAVSVEQIRVLASALPKSRPLHIHVAEQQAEVEQCLAATGQRPLHLLHNQVGLDARWCAVHATHLDPGELSVLAHSGAVAGLCPSTEANLGDGLFALPGYLAAGGRFGIGSDSQVSQSPVEELRWLEYGQRLLQQRRLVAAPAGADDFATGAWLAAAAGGAQASGRSVGALEPGRQADLLVLDHKHPAFASCSLAEVLGILLFCGNDVLVKDVLAGGRWVVRDGRHVAHEALEQGYRGALASLHGG